MLPCIVFEGPDCAGKSTCVNMLYENLRLLNIDALKVKHPEFNVNNVLTYLTNKDDFLYCLTFALDDSISDPFRLPGVRNDSIILHDRHMLISGLVYQNTEDMNSLDKSIVDLLRIRAATALVERKPLFIFVNASEKAITSRLKKRDLTYLFKYKFEEHINETIE